MLSFQANPSTSQRGVTTHAPQQAQTCLEKNAFGTPGLGVLPALPFREICLFHCGQRPKLASLFGFVVSLHLFKSLS